MNATMNKTMSQEEFVNKLEDIQSKSIQYGNSGLSVTALYVINMYVESNISKTDASPFLEKLNKKLNISPTAYQNMISKGSNQDFFRDYMGHCIANIDYSTYTEFPSELKEIIKATKGILDHEPNNSIDTVIKNISVTQAANRDSLANERVIPNQSIRSASGYKPSALERRERGQREVENLYNRHWQTVV